MRHHFQFSMLALLLGLCLGFASCRSTAQADDEASSKVVAADPLVRYYVVADG